MLRNKPGRLASIITLLFFSCATGAEVYFCEDNAGVSIDRHGISTSTQEPNEFERQEWVVDIEKGWRRADLTDFRGACELNKGYIVCKAHDIAFGEATFSIHPDESNFILVYIDYGLNTLSFVGKCEKN